MTWRRGPRRMNNYSTDTNEEYAQETLETGQERSAQSRPENAQAQNTENKEDKKSNEQDIMLLLEKINLQLENMRLTEQNQQQDSAEVRKAKPEKTGLEQMVTQLLQNNNTNQDSINGDKTQDNQKQTNDANTLLGQLLKKNEKSSSKTQQENKSPKPNADTMVLQTAAEVLSRAQYELSNELENSLKKLKQVISESEQIANKISNLIEQKQQ
ncbi:MAG: hypothetical protein LLG02_06500 [Pelosinus sp.]|nr:hypothetical protein [Pelosinus sp.]